MANLKAIEIHFLCTLFLCAPPQAAPDILLFENDLFSNAVYLFCIINQLSSYYLL